MKKGQRKIHWYLIYPIAGLLFIALSVFFILSARGYKFGFYGKKLGFEKVGMIITSSKPANAVIFINGKQFKKKTSQFFSVKIEDLKKGKYDLKIEKDGYYPWEKEISVLPEMVSWANYVLFFSKNPDIKKTNLKGVLAGNLISKDNKSDAMLVTLTDRFLIFLSDNNSDEPTVLFDSSKIQPLDLPSDVKLLNWSKDRKSLFLTGKIAGQNQTFVLNTETKTLDNLNKLFPLRFENISTNNSNSDEIFTLQDKTLFRVNFRSRVTSTVDSSIDFVASADNKVFYVKTRGANKALWQMNFDGTSKSLVFDSIPLSQLYEIKVSTKNEKITLFAKDNSSLYLLDKLGDKYSLFKVGENITDFSWSQDGERLFMQAKGSAEVLEMDDFKKESREYDIQKADSYKGLTWYDSRHLIGNKQDKVVVMDFDGTNVVELADVLSESQPFFMDNGNIYFFSPSQNPQTVIYSAYKVEF